jgi:hypothetical protein
VLYPTIKHELQTVSSEIHKIQQQLLAFPSGHLSCLHNGKYIKWIQSEKSKQSIISKKNRSFAQQLAVKNYLSSLLFDLIQEKKSLASYLSHYKNFTPHVEQFLKNPYFSDLLPQTILSLSEELSTWMNEPFSQNTSYPEHLKFHSISGNILRSKSEVFIDQLLYRKSIPYRYECLLQLDDFSFYPDFTIRHPQTGALLYWEHFGMMDNPSYAQKTFQKLELYTSHGYIPGVNFITTFETMDHPLDINYIESLVNHFFCV